MKRIFSLLIVMFIVLGMVSTAYATDTSDYYNGMTGEEYQQYLINLAEEGQEDTVYYTNLVLKKVVTDKKGAGTQLMLYDPDRHLMLVFDFVCSAKEVKMLKGADINYDYAYAEDYLFIHRGDLNSDDIIYSDQDDINNLE